MKKPKSKGRKAGSVETETTEELIGRLSLADFFIDEQPYATLFSGFQTRFLDQSVLRGLIHTENPTLSGDGTPVVAAARERGHKICDCISKGVFRRSCPRFFSQPDCDIAWDSSRNLYYSGCDLYLMTDTDGGPPLSFRSFTPPPNMIPTDFAKSSYAFLPLEAGHHRSTQMWYVRLYAIVMSLHLDAWPAS